jgi:hypothetical protein
VSSTSASAKDKDKDKDTTHFIGRKIAPVPIPPKRFVLIKQSLPGVLAIGEVEVISNGVNVALHKSVQNSGANTYVLDTSKTPSLSQTHAVSTGDYTISTECVVSLSLSLSLSLALSQTHAVSTGDYTISTGNHTNTKSSDIVCQYTWK